MRVSPPTGSGTGHVKTRHRLEVVLGQHLAVGRKAAALHWGARPSIERPPRGDDGIAVERRHDRRCHLASRRGAAARKAAKQSPPRAAR